VTEHYNARPEEGIKKRTQSRIIRLRSFNNWLKSVLIERYTRVGYSVLDFACGKGGDLNKWTRAKISNYVGCDTADQSLVQLADRWNSLPEPRYAATLLCGDCFAVHLASYLPPEMEFDVVSCQFAVHYAFESEQRVRRMLRNVSERLKPGGIFLGTTIDSNVLIRKLHAAPGLEFGNAVYYVKFDDRHASKQFDIRNPFGIRYYFTLDENVVDCPEFVVHFDTFTALADEYALELIERENFHEFYENAMKERASLERFKHMKVTDEFDRFSFDQWDAEYLYTTFVFRKKGADSSLGMDPSTLTQQLQQFRSSNRNTLTAEDVIQMQ